MNLWPVQFFLIFYAFSPKHKNKFLSKPNKNTRSHSMHKIEKRLRLFVRIDTEYANREWEWSIQRSLIFILFITTFVRLSIRVFSYKFIDFLSKPPRPRQTNCSGSKNVSVPSRVRILVSDMLMIPSTSCHKYVSKGPKVGEAYFFIFKHEQKKSQPTDAIFFRGRS